MENRVIQLESRVAENKESIKDLEKRMQNQEGNNKVQEYQYKCIMDILNELKGDVKELKSEPKKKYDLWIAAIVTGLVGWLVATLLPII